MSLADRITARPLAFDPRIGAEAAAPYAGLGPAFEDLVAGAAGSSGYLSSLIGREVAWLSEAASRAPEDTLADLLTPPEADSRSGLSRHWRIAKRRAALLTALCDLGGVWSLEEVTGALTQLADAALQSALSFLVAEAQARGKLPPVDAPDGGLVVLAMGKMGAFELNYSSDIDLIVLFDEGLYPGDAYAEVRQGFIRVTQAMTRLMSDVTEDGYVFRTDLRLRPDPSVTPVAIGMGAAERYYESQGRTWERAAMIKARACAGDIAAGERFLDDIGPFIWRRHLDFAAIEDAHNMRLRIRAHKGLEGPIQLPGHDVKLGRGGIREIEFFAQTRQLICGGRDASLRLAQTKPALDALVAGGWLDGGLAEDFKAAYTAHRVLEHRIQMLEDAQTHRYPKAEEARARICGLYGQVGLEAFEAPVTARFKDVHAKAEAFFAHETGQTADGASPWDAFPDAEAAQAIVDGWRRVPALRSDRSRAIFTRLAPGLAERLLGAARPEVALSHFDRFLKGLPAGVQVLSLFEANPQILDLLVDICAMSPKLADYLGRNASVLDAVLTPDFFQPQDEATMCAEALAAVEAAGDYEGQLDSLRIWTHEHQFRTGVHLLRGLCTPREAGAAYTAIADAVLQALLPVVEDEFARRHGRITGARFAVIGMGKLGSGEMTASSDLDLITIYDAPGGSDSDGAKPLPATTYFQRLTQTLINALTAQTAHGLLYATDMRLRPSGRQGPVATSLSGFRTYQAEEAWTWEHLALTRARPVAGPEGLRAEIDAAIGDALAQNRDRAKIIADVREMRARLASAKGREAAEAWEIKHGPGRMLDIELAVQTGRLLHPGIGARSPFRMIAPLREAGYLDDGEAEGLTATLTLLSAVQHLGRLALDEGFAPDKAGPGLARVLCDLTGAENLAALETALRDGAARAAEVVGAILDRAERT